jgi:hypothetical protein
MSTIKMMAVGFVVLGGVAYYQMPGRKMAAERRQKSQAYDMVNEAIDADPDLSRIDHIFAYKSTISGTADSPEALERLRAVYQEASALNPDIKFSARLLPGYTPYAVGGRVVDRNGEPIDKVFVEMEVLEYVAPKEARARNVQYVNHGRRQMHVADDGSFEFKNIPTHEDAKVVLTVREPYPEETVVICPINTDHAVISLPVSMEEERKRRGL